MPDSKSLSQADVDVLPRFSPTSESDTYRQGVEGGQRFELADRGSSITTAAAIVESPHESLVDVKSGRRAQFWAFAAIIWSMFMEGWNDGTNGPLLPTMQRSYHIGFTVVSVIFITNCIGFMTAAFANVRLFEKLGFGTTMVVGAISQAIAYCLQAPAPPFPLFAIAPVFSGFGVALQNAGELAYAVHCDRNASMKVAIIQAAYGVGALMSPLSATAFSTKKHWSFHYLASLGGSIGNIIFLILVFRFQNLDTLLKKAGQTVREQGASQENLYRQMFKLKAAHLLAIFAFAYVGAEVTLGGWIVTFVIDERHGGSASGYITSGFFAGLTLGRVALLWVNRLVGERRVVWLYVTLCIILEITIWLVPSLIGNAIAVAFIGLLLGPIYPIMITTAERLVPRWLLTGTVGWIGAVGQAGSALVPFVTGALSSKFGVISLQPLIVSVFCVMLGLWAAVPKEIRRSE